MMRTKDGHVIIPAMYLQDINGLYKVLSVDDIRRVAEVQEIYIDEGGMTYPVGQSWYRTATDLKRCEIL